MRRDDGLIKKAYIWLPLIALAILPLILSIWSSLGTWEGRLFPVVEQTTLKTWERVPGGFTAQWHYYKGRSCRPVAIAFYAGERESGSGFSKIPIQRISIRDEPDQLVANSPANPLGWQDSSIYKLWTDTPPITEDNLNGQISQQINWFSDVEHRCHFFWITRSRFWN